MLLLFELPFELIDLFLVFFQLFIVFVLVEEFIFFLFKLKWLVLVNVEIGVHFDKYLIEPLC